MYFLNCFSAGSCLRLPLINATPKTRKPAKPGGAGTTKLATLRDEQSWHPWKNYWFATLFAIHGRAFPMLPMLFYTSYVILMVVFIKYSINDFSNYKELLALQYPVQTIGLALFLLLTFRTQTAYDRWWEGRKAWGGIIATSGDLSRIAEAWVDDPVLAAQLITWTTVFAVAVKQKLHYSRDMSEVSDMVCLGDMRKMMACDDLPLYALTRASHVLKKVNKADYHIALMMVEADKALKTLFTELCSCLRIRNTPMPWAYVVHLRAFLILWFVILPLAFVSTLHWYSIPLSVLIGYELLGYEEIGVEIENPFGTDFSDLPLEGLTATIALNAQHYLTCIQTDKSHHNPAPPPPPPKTNGAPLVDRLPSTPFRDASQSGDLKDRSNSGALNDRSQSGSGAQLKARSQSAVAAAHVLENKAALSKLTQHHQEENQRKLYDRLGGNAAVEAAVDIFYQKLLGDIRVARFFNGISIERLKFKQVKFLTYALGGADEYVGLDPTISHRRLHNEKGLRVTHFYVVVGHLQDTLRELGVTEELIAECTEVLAPMEKTFLCGEDHPCIGHKPEKQDSAAPVCEAEPEAITTNRETCPF